MKQSILYALFSALITAAFITGAPAFGQSPAGESGSRVSFVQTADLDLSSNPGQRLLQQRLARAAREVCGTASDSDLQGKNEVRDCREDAIARASSQSDRLIATAARGPVIAVSARR